MEKYYGSIEYDAIDETEISSGRKTLEDYEHYVTFKGYVSEDHKLLQGSVVDYNGWVSVIKQEPATYQGLFFEIPKEAAYACND